MSNWYFPFSAFKDGEQDRLYLDQAISSQKKVGQLDNIRGKNELNAFITSESPPEQDIPTRSIKTKGGDYEISFQAGFMEEHQSAFKKQTQNLVESSFKQMFSLLLGFKVFDKFDWRSHSTKRLSIKEKKQFQKDKKTQQKLSKFLKMIQDSTFEELYSEIQFIAYLCWENYLHIRDQRLAENRLIEKAEKLAKEDYQKIFDESGIKFLNFDVFEEVRKQAFLRFIIFFYTTIFLVVQEYFGNPYSSQEGAKRPRDFNFQEDLQDEFSSSQSSNFYRNLPAKKLSFPQ